MPLQIQRGDITKVKADAIVNAANPVLSADGAVSRAIRTAAGPAVEKECRRIGRCRPGEVCITGAGRLPARYILHAVGPLWENGTAGEQVVLKSCYMEALNTAQTLGCRSVAFPLIGTGEAGCPRDLALSIAVDAIGSFLQSSDMQVYLVLFGSAPGLIRQDLREELEQYIGRQYIGRMLHSGAVLDQHLDTGWNSLSFALPQRTKQMEDAPPAADCAPFMPEAPEEYTSLADTLSHLGESFSEMLLRKIDEKGMTDAECYRKANLDRRLFSKIRSKRSYQPSKITVLACAIALELSIEETKEMLQAAGFAFSQASKADLIVTFFIERGNYNILEINDALFDFGEKTLG